MTMLDDVSEDALGVVSQWLPGYVMHPDGEYKVALVRVQDDDADVYRYTPLGDSEAQPRYFEVRVSVKEVSE